MWKSCKVVMLPTNEKAAIGDTRFSIVNEEVDKTLRYGKKIQEPYNCSLTDFHLYFLSDKEIKEGFTGYAIVKDDTRIHYLVEVILSEKNQCYCKGDRKFSYESVKEVIASTDSTLLVGNDSNPLNNYFLPQPSQSFIEKYVTEYNKGNVINEVLVEYETKNEKAKIYPDNTINIKDWTSGKFIWTD